MTPTFLHVGLPKTGTTSLQGNLFSRHSQLDYVGKPALHGDETMRTAMRPFVEAPDGEFDAEAAGQNIRDLYSKGNGRPLLVSEEEFSTGTHRVRVEPDVIASRLADAFPGAGIIITIRRQEDVFQSLYSHLMNVGFMPPIHFGEWIRHERSLPGDRGRFRLFDYDHIHRRYCELFGAERVRTLLFEDLKDDPGAFISEVCHFLGIDPEEGSYLAEDDRPLNPRVNRRQLAWRRFCRASSPIPWEGVIRRLRLSPAVDRILADGPPLKLEYGSDDLDFLRERFGPSNRNLADRLGVDLAARGYAT